MKLVIDNNLIKELEKRFKKHTYYLHDIVEIHGIHIDFIENTCYTFTVCWGHSQDKSREEEWHTKDLFVMDKDFSLDFIEGMFTQLVYDLEDAMIRRGMVNDN